MKIFIKDDKMLYAVLVYKEKHKGKNNSKQKSTEVVDTGKEFKVEHNTRNRHTDCNKTEKERSISVTITMHSRSLL